MKALAVALGVLLPAMWPMYQARPDHNAVFVSSQAAYSWRRTLGGKINGGLAIVGNRLFVESFDRRVTALNARSGAILWARAVPNVVMTTPIVAGGIVIAGTGTSAVLDELPQKLVWGRPQGDAIVGMSAETGRILWRYRTIGQDMPSPALATVNGRDVIVFANGDDHLRALDPRTGRALWVRRVDGIATMSSAATDRGEVYVIIGTGANSHRRDRLIAIDPATGSILWSASYGNADCSPTIGDGRVFVEGSIVDGGLAYNDVAAIDESSGKLHWRWYSSGGRLTSVASDEQAIAGVFAEGTFYESIPATDQFAAFSPAGGKPRWIIRTAAPVKMSAVDVAGVLYFGDTGGFLYAVDARTGRVLTRTRYPSFFTTSSPIVFGKTLYVANDHTVYALHVPLSP